MEPMAVEVNYLHSIYSNSIATIFLKKKQDDRARGATKDDGGSKTPLIIVGIVVLVLAIALILSVILTLPRTLTCFPHDDRFFVQLVPNATIARVDPPMVCLAQFSQVRWLYCFLK